MAAEADFAFARLVEQKKEPRQRRLAGAGLADDTERLPGADVEIKLVERDDGRFGGSKQGRRATAEAFGQAACGEDCFGHAAGFGKAAAEAVVVGKRCEVERFGAGGFCVGAARREAAARGPVCERGGWPGMTERRLALAALRARGFDECGGVPVAGAVEDVAKRRVFNNLARVHDDDALAHARDHAEVVADQSIAMPRSRRRPASMSRKLRWTVTSSAVVGSSAMSSFGSRAMAMAPTTRWRMPPLSWCG